MNTLRLSARRGLSCLAGILAAAALMFGGACAPQSAKGPARAMELFESGQHDQALREASAQARRSSGPTRDRASLVAGMSAYELDRVDDAERWLRPLIPSADAEVAGRAAATLGLINAGRGNFTAAAIDLASAGRKLQGEEAARANYHAAECYTISGRLDAAKRLYAMALTSTTNPGTRARIEARLRPSAFTVQIGAFRDRVNADRAAGAAAERARPRGLPAPSIIDATDVTGRRLHLVQVGRFATRDLANTARLRLGGEAVVVPVEPE